MEPYIDHTGLWERELRGWVPERIFDAHVHLGPPGAVGRVDRNAALTWFRGLEWEELSLFYGELLRGKRVTGAIVFPFPFRETDVDAANDYIVELMRRDPRVNGFLLVHPTDMAPTLRACERARAAGVRFRGVKPYFDLLGRPNSECTMPEFIPEALWDLLAAEGMAMMLHTSGQGVGDPANRRYLRDVCSRYPGVPIVLAHLGRYYRASQFHDFVASGVLEDCPSLYLDMSSASETSVYERLLERPPLRSRLVFASDLPYGLLTGVERWIEETGSSAFLTRDEYPWSDHELLRSRALDRRELTYNTYHCIKALKDAFDSLSLRGEAAEELKAAIFEGNVRRLVLRES